MAFWEARERPYGVSLRSYEKVAYHKKFLEIQGAVEAPEATQTPFTHPVPGGWGVAG